MSLQREIFELLAEHERQIGRLYQSFAQSFPDDAEFWLRLAREEESHAVSVLTLGEKIRQGHAYLRAGRFSPEALRSSLAFLEQQLNAAENPALSRLQALSAALDIEEAMIERKYFEVARGDSPALQGLLQSLAKETLRHHALLKEKWEAARKEN